MAERDEQLARSLLQAAQQIGARLHHGWVSGSVLADAARDGDARGFDSDSQAERIIGDVLIQNGLLEEQINPNGDSPGLRRRRFRLTSLGWKLLMGREDVPPIPGVADPRLEA